MAEIEKAFTEGPDPEIEEGDGRFPWFVWVAVLIWVFYAFFVAPFEWTNPGG